MLFEAVLSSAHIGKQLKCKGKGKVRNKLSTKP
jgi:hypothetical protein